MSETDTVWGRLTVVEDNRGGTIKPMSTKIFNGWRYHNPRCPASPFELVEAFNHTIGGALTEKCRRDAIINAVAMIDGSVTVTDNEATSSALGTAARRAYMAQPDRQTNAQRERGGYDAQIVMIQDPDDVHTLYLLVYSRVGLEEELESIDGISEFCYWNNTDQPEDIDDQEWEHRRDTWDRLVGWKPPSSVGVAWTAPDVVLDALNAPELREQFDRYIPPDSQRAKAIVQTEALDAMAKPALDNHGSTATCVGAIHDTIAQAHSNVDAIEEARTKLEPVTWERLTNGPIIKQDAA